MSELHVYTDGQDPYVLPLGDLRLVIHAGPPPGSGGGAGGGSGSGSGGGTAGGTGGEGGVAVPTPLPTPFRDLWVRDLGEVELPSLMPTRPGQRGVMIHLLGPTAGAPRIDGLLAQLRGLGPRAIEIHLVDAPDDDVDGTAETAPHE